MKKYLITALLTSGIMVAVMAGMLFLLSSNGRKASAQKEKKQAEELDMTAENGQKEKVSEVEAVLLSAKKGNVYTFQYKDTNSIYDAVHSASVKKELDKKKLITNYTIDNPLWAVNPFGTNHLSMYLYFQSSEPGYLKYTIHVKDADIPDFTRTLYNGEGIAPSDRHEYQLTGLVPGMDNYIILRLYNRKNKLVEKAIYKINIGDLNKNIPVRLEKEKGTSKGEMSNGLFFVLGYDIRNKEVPKDILFYDNSGCIRGDIPLVNYRSDRIEYAGKNMVYSYKQNGFAAVSSLGQVMNTYSIDGYKQHHDFVYNGYGQLWILASENDKKSGNVEDVVLSLDLKTGEVSKLLDFEKLLKNVEKKAKKNNKDDKTLDWIHLNSITMLGSSDIVVSSRELSSLIKVSDVNSKVPKVEYIISEPDAWKKTGYTGLLLQKALQNQEEDVQPEEEDADREYFTSQFGQHTVTYEESPSLEDGQYYLYMFNNNFGVSTTRKDLDWKQYKGIGLSGKPAKYSYYYKYLVDENKGTYMLVESIPVPYSAIVSSTQNAGRNRVINSGVAHVFGEYDNAGKLLYQYSCPADSYTYRVFKYDMKQFWYQ